MTATRMVFLADELERLGLVERRRDPADRRSHALYLTVAGREMLGRVLAATAEHEARMAAGLTAAQRADLIRLLRLTAGQQGLPARGLPGIPPVRKSDAKPGSPPG